MQWVDILIIVLVLLSGLISLMRGFVKEAVSLVIWALSVFLAVHFAQPLGQRMFGMVHGEQMNYALSFAVIMVACLLLGALINAAVSSLVKKTGASAFDRFLGIIFGLARGYIVVTVLLLLATFSKMPHTNWWQQSRCIPYFQPSISWLKAMLPDQVAGVSKWLDESKRVIKQHTPGAQTRPKPAPETQSKP